MTDDQPLDLSRLTVDVDRRSKVVSRVVARAIFRRNVTRRLARLPIPAGLLAAAVLLGIWLTWPRPRAGEPFAALVVSERVTREWVVLGRTPDPRALLGARGEPR